MLQAGHVRHLQQLTQHYEVMHAPERSFSTAVMFSAGVLAFSVTDCSDSRKPCRTRRWQRSANLCS
jgi:hypothetical protein